MKDIQKDRSLATFADDLVYVEAGVSADPQTEHLAQDVVEALGLVDQMLQKEQDIHRQKVKNRADIKAKIRRAEHNIRLIYAALLFVVTNNRKDPRYQTLIKHDLSSLLRLTSQAQMQELLRMQTILTLTIYDDDFRDEQNALIDASVNEFQGVQDLLTQMETRQMHHRLEVEQCKESVNKARGTIYADLTKISKAHKKDKAWVRSFFPESRAAKSKKLSPEQLAKKKVESAQRAADKLTLATQVANEKVRKADLTLQLETEKAALEAKIFAEEQDKARASIRLQLTADLKAQMEQEELDKILAEKIAREKREVEEALLRNKLNGSGDSAQV